MNEPQSIEDIFESCREQDWGWDGDNEYSTETFNVDKAKAAIEAMVREIIGPDGEVTSYIRPQGYPGVDLTQSYYNSLRKEQRLRASKYNLKLEKE